MMPGFAKEAPKNREEQHLTDQFVGTPDYASCSALMGRRQRAKDDIESLGYSLLEMYLGEVAEHSLTSEGP
jgi:hypothetical protein